MWIFESENFAAHAPHVCAAKFADFLGILLIKIYIIGS